MQYMYLFTNRSSSVTASLSSSSSYTWMTTVNMSRKVRPFFDPLIKNFQLAYHPSCELSIDESMIGFKGRLSFIQYLPKKTNQVGDEGICPCRQQERVHIQLAAVHRYAETIKPPA